MDNENGCCGGCCGGNCANRPAYGDKLLMEAALIPDHPIPMVLTVSGVNIDGADTRSDGFKIGRDDGMKDGRLGLRICMDSRLDGLSNEFSQNYRIGYEFGYDIGKRTADRER